MLFAGAVSTDVGVRPFGYLTSMVVTIALWLTVTPAIGAVAGRPGKKPGKNKESAGRECGEDRTRKGPAPGGSTDREDPHEFPPPAATANDLPVRATFPWMILTFYQFLRVFPTLYQFQSFLRP